MGATEEYCLLFKQILEVAFYKTVVWPRTSHLESYPYKNTLISKIFFWTRIHGHTSWSTSKNSHLSSLCRHWMPSRGFVKSGDGYRQIARKSRGNLYLHVLMVINCFWSFFTRCEQGGIKPILLWMIDLIYFQSSSPEDIKDVAREKLNWSCIIRTCNFGA